MIALVLLILGIIGGLASRPTAASVTDSEQVTVTDVVDGDTLDIQYSNGSTDTVRTDSAKSQPLPPPPRRVHPCNWASSDSDGWVAS
ncbi:MULTISPECIES: hypothetical protein [unclassified Haladaptatus]|uniref:hypothetical protein n=1 Tax=unclassified Haladaptatus TaxID=2622732 RepID=UPI00209C659E|nr:MULTISPECIES: hypothetical protein [unclassified Haladaptatus]MCO8246897.1 hypothetical protein [Haladaptatus sp. AB643]MCO8253577.1 hypothetical protein [Haladaptatus sp. AB618]